MKKIFLIIFILISFFFLGCNGVNENNKNTYTVLFDSNGGSIVNKQEVVEGDLITKPTDPVKDNYLFDGWYLGDAKIDFTNYKVSSDVTLIAKWLEIDPQKEYVTVIFNSNGGSTVDSQTIEKGELIKSLSSPTKDGYTFDGWYNGEEKWNFEADVVLTDITLVAKWNANTYKITLDLAGGTGVSQTTIEVTYGDTITLPQPTNEGDDFIGWYYGDKKFVDTIYLYPFDITLKAGWEIIDDFPTQITITGDNELFVGAAYSIHLTASVIPENASHEVIWTSNNESVVTVDEFGVVTGVSIGIARIRATSKKCSDVKSPFFTITVKNKEDYPPADLKGYTIVIMNAESALGDIDPFLDSYTQYDKSYKQEAWREVELMYNCKIEAKAYPQEAPWGEPRIHWLINNAKQGTSQCDLAIIYSNWLNRFTELRGNDTEITAIDVTDYYKKYGENQMSLLQKEAGSYHGKIYVASTGIDPFTINTDFGLYYNLALLEKIGVESPAKMFNEGRWTYTNFAQWVRDAQAKLGSTAEEPKYVLGGHPYYWWFGMTNAGGVKVYDTVAIKINLLADCSKESCAMLNALYKEGCMDKVGSWCGSSADGNSWFKGNCLMVTGYMWFVKSASRWYCDADKKIWGEDTRFGYVPFPYPDSMPKEQTRISTSGLSAYMYVRGREYPAGVTVEGIYQAVNQMFLDTYKKAKADPLINSNDIVESRIKNKIDDPYSIEAIKFFDSSKLFYDPLDQINNHISWNSIMNSAVDVIFNGRDYDEAFNEAIGPIIYRDRGYIFE